MLGDDVRHLARLERDIPSSASETAGRVDRLHPFVQRVPLRPVLRAVGALDLEREDHAASKAHKKIRDVSPPGARPHVVNLETEVIVLDVGKNVLAHLEGIGRVALLGRFSDQMAYVRFGRREARLGRVPGAH